MTFARIRSGGRRRGAVLRRDGERNRGGGVRGRPPRRCADGHRALHSRRCRWRRGQRRLSRPPRPMLALCGAGAVAIAAPCRFGGDGGGDDAPAVGRTAGGGGAAGGRGSSSGSADTLRSASCSDSRSASRSAARTRVAAFAARRVERIGSLEAIVGSGCRRRRWRRGIRVGRGVGDEGGAARRPRRPAAGLAGSRLVGRRLPTSSKAFVSAAARRMCGPTAASGGSRRGQRAKRGEAAVLAWWCGRKPRRIKQSRGWARDRRAHAPKTTRAPFRSNVPFASLSCYMA